MTCCLEKRTGYPGGSRAYVGTTSDHLWIFVTNFCTLHDLPPIKRLIIMDVCGWQQKTSSVMSTKYQIIQD